MFKVGKIDQVLWSSSSRWKIVKDLSAIQITNFVQLRIWTPPRNLTRKFSLSVPGEPCFNNLNHQESRTLRRRTYQSRPTNIRGQTNSTRLWQDPFQTFETSITNKFISPSTECWIKQLSRRNYKILIKLEVGANYGYNILRIQFSLLQINKVSVPCSQNNIFNDS